MRYLFLGSRCDWCADVAAQDCGHATTGRAPDSGAFRQPAAFLPSGETTDTLREG